MKVEMAPPAFPIVRGRKATLDEDDNHNSPVPLLTADSSLARHVFSPVWWIRDD